MASRTFTFPTGFGHRIGAKALAACVLAVLVCLGTSAIAHAGVPAVSGAAASPAAFVPDWDGHTDATVIQYTLAERSSVAVRIVDSKLRVVATIDAGIRPAGTHIASWDGRDSAGVVQPAGAYRVKVDARPLGEATAAGEPGSANSGGGVTAASLGAPITLQDAPVAVRGIRLSRANLGRRGAVSRTAATFDLSVAASVSAAIVDAKGRPLRTLATGRMGAGANTVSWDGRTATGIAVADGDYTLVVAASGSGRPTSTDRLPLVVDRTVPRVTIPKRVRASVSGTKVTASLTVKVPEATTISIGSGKRVVRRDAAAGTTTLALTSGTLGGKARSAGRTVALKVRIADEAGNAVVRMVRVTVPAKGAASTPPPTTNPNPGTTTPPPTTSVPGGKVQWPLDGIVTSPFGMRDGRAHTGLDIAAPTGTPIHPAAPGTVSYVGVLGGYGNLVIVEHPSGMRTYYAHMSRFGSFGVGAAVRHTDVLGLVGCTGTCTGPHVHFETRIGDVPKDPRAYLVAG